MVATTVSRVPCHTAEEVNQQIRRQTEENIHRFGAASAEEIAARLDELDQEWDIERAIEANASSVMLVAIALGTFVNRRFWALPVVVAGFLLQHSVQGWCPPVPILRRLGFRTQYEIEQERYALKALRGDFEKVSGIPGIARRASGVMDAVRR